MSEKFKQLSDLMAAAQRDLSNGYFYLFLSKLRTAFAKAEALESELRTGETPKVGE